jgi:hypothetical protein
MLEKHPDTMSDSELYKKINSWVRTKTPESSFLDYKRDLNFGSQKEKIELAKDISSFANSAGGCLIYGIDEQREGEKSIPIPKEQYGILPIEGNVIDIENILTSIISPSLPDLTIRTITLEHEPDKVVYLLWHSKSWFAPHMVTGFKHTRYYKRGNFKAEPMQEHEIEAKYRERIATYEYTGHYIKNIDYGLPYTGANRSILKIAVAPLYLISNNKYFSYGDSDKLLPAHRRGTAISILDGVVFKSYPGYYIIKIYFNGSISICVDMVKYLSTNIKSGMEFKLLDPEKLYRLFSVTIWPFISHFYKNLKINSPVILNLCIDNPKGILLKTQQTDFQISDHEPLNEHQLQDLIYNNLEFEFSETFSVRDLFIDTQKVIESLIDRIKYGFGSFNMEYYPG